MDWESGVNRCKLLHIEGRGQYVNNKLSGREIKERIPFSIASKRIKYLWLKLPKEAEIPVVQKV